MPTNHFFAMFRPSQWLVRTELWINAPASQEVSWKNNCYQITFDSWGEALDEVIKLSDHWDSEIREYLPNLYVRFNRTGPGGWVIEGFDAESLCPKQIHVDCEVYVCGVIEDEEKWYVATYNLVNQLEAFQPQPDPEPDQHDAEPDDNWYVIAKEFLEKLNEEATETEPEPSYAVARDFEHYDYLNRVDPEPEPDPEPEQPQPDQDWEPTTLITRGYLRVTVETHGGKVIEGNKAFNLPYHRADAVWQAGVYVSEIRNRITNLIGLPPETQSFNKSPYWDMPDRDRGNWCEWVCTWRADFYQGLERVTFEWGFDHDQPPFEAEEREDCTEPLWLGCITLYQPRGKRSTCSASAKRSALAEWIKGGVETYALLTDYCGLDSEHIVGKHSLTDSSERDINITVGDLSGEGIRLI